MPVEHYPVKYPAESGSQAGHRGKQGSQLDLVWLIAAFVLISGFLLVAAWINMALPGDEFVESLYAVPMLLAARSLSIRGTIIAVAGATLLHIVVILQVHNDGMLMGLSSLGVAAVGALAITLATVRARALDRAAAAESAEARTSAVLQSITDGFFALDRQWRFTYVNVRAEQILRARREDLLGRTVWEAFPILAEMPYRNEAERAMTQRVPVHFEAFYPPRSVWFEAHAYPSDEGLAVYFRDVTWRKRKEEALREAEAKHRSLIEQIPAVTYTTMLAAPGEIAGTGSASYISPQIEALLGYTAEEWTRQPGLWASRIHPDDRDRVLAANDRVNHTGEPLHVDYRMVARSGRIVWVREESILVRDAAGQPRCWQGIIQDITLEKQAEAEREAAADRIAYLAQTSRELTATLPDYAGTLQGVVDAAVPVLADWCVLYLMAEDGTIRRAALAHDRSQDAAVAERLRSLPTLWDVSSSQWQSLEAGQTIYVPSVSRLGQDIPLKSGKQADIVHPLQTGSVVVAPLQARGRMLGALLCMRRVESPAYTPADVVFIEEVARRSALVVDNARLYREAREAIKTRDEFLSVASHELKTPLTSIKGYFQLLDRRMAKEPPDVARLRETMDKLRPHLSRFERIVRDLLDVSRIQEGQLRLHPEPGDLVAIVREVFDALEHSDEHDPAQPMHLEAPESLPGIWDSTRIAQVVANLLSNALRYSMGRGGITVRVRAEGDDAVIAVRDEGIGMTLEEQARVFEPFFRSDAVVGAIAGTGLGLHITRRIVEHHGGTIQVESAPGRGSTFTIRLPCRWPTVHDQDGPTLDGREVVPPPEPVSSESARH